MLNGALLLLRDHSDDMPPGYGLLFALIAFSIIGLFLWWHLKLGRQWRQYHARNWRQIAGKFDEGEVVAMRKGRSPTADIAGYQVYMWYDYEADGEQLGLFTLPFHGEYSTEEEAERYRRIVANRDILVRVSPRNPKRSCVLDEDVRPMLSAN